MRATDDRPATVHTAWCTDHREADLGTPGYCVGDALGIPGVVSVSLDQNEPGGEPVIYVGEMGPTDSLTIAESRQLRAILEDLERQAGGS